MQKRVFSQIFSVFFASLCRRKNYCSLIEAKGDIHKILVPEYRKFIIETASGRLKMYTIVNINKDILNEDK